MVDTCARHRSAVVTSVVFSTVALDPRRGRSIDITGTVSMVGNFVSSTSSRDASQEVALKVEPSNVLRSCT